MRKKNDLWRCRRFLAALCLCLLLPGTLTACSADTKVVLTTTLKKNEIFRIGEASCTLPEAMVYLTNMQNQYESVYGEEIWQAKDNGETLEEEVKAQVLALLAQVKAMTLLAKEKEIALTAKEEERVAAAAKEYYASLNETEIASLGVDEETIRRMYQEYALSAKVYQEIVEDVNPEISDDEARTITVLSIRLSDYETAAEVLAQAKEEGTDFESLAETRSEDTTVSYSFGKGEMDAAIEKAAFDLGKDEISDVITAQDGFYVLKCISTFDEAQTRINKEKIANERRNEAFNNEYDTFVNALVRQLNDELWESVAFIGDENVQTDSFFQVYGTYFQTQ